MDSWMITTRDDAGADSARFSDGRSFVMDRERLREAYRQLDELDTMGSDLPDEGDPTDRGAILNLMVTGGEKFCGTPTPWATAACWPKPT